MGSSVGSGEEEERGGVEDKRKVPKEGEVNDEKSGYRKGGWKMQGSGEEHWEGGRGEESTREGRVKRRGRLRK